MKYISRITALLLVLMMLTPTFASALTLGTATQGDLDRLYQEAMASLDGVRFNGLIGQVAILPVQAEGTSNRQWYQIIENEDGTVTEHMLENATGEECQVVFQAETYAYYCRYTDNSDQEQCTVKYIIEPTRDLDEYLAELSWGFDFRCANTDVWNTHAIYQHLNTVWNVTLDGANLAESIVAYWWNDGDVLDTEVGLLCSCVVDGVVSDVDECMLNPASDRHAESCGWAKPVIMASADVSTPEKLLALDGKSLVLTTTVQNADNYSWQNYVFDEDMQNWIWQSFASNETLVLTVSKETIQTAYRLMLAYASDDEGSFVDTKPLYLGGYDFFNWILTNEDIQAWMADDSVTLADVVARYNEKDCINADDYTYEGENGESLNLKVPEGAFTEEYVMEVEPVAADEAALLQNTVLQSMDATGTHTAQLLMALDISFANLNNRAEKLQPAEGTSVALTFEVDTTGINEALKYLYVYHIANDGTPEVVAGPIDAAFGKQTIVVQADGFSEYLVMATNDECAYCQHSAMCLYAVLADMTHQQQFEYLQTLNGSYAAYMSDYVRHVEAGAPAILCTCVNYAEGIKPNAPMDGSHGTICPWSDNASHWVGVLGTPVTLELKPEVYKEYKWFIGNTNGTPISTESTYTVTYTKEEQLYICQVKDANDVWSEHWFRVQADMTVMYEYLAYLGVEFVRDDGMFDREAIYNVMTKTWNVPIDDNEDNILAKAILVYWKYNYMPGLEEDMFCSCCIGEGDIVSDQIMLHPDALHDEACPWYTEVEVIIPPIPDQPQLYYGNPDGAQYTSTETYSLPMADNRAVILPKGGRAILTSRKTGGQWQVHTGSEWVDIQGESASTIVITEAKLHTIFAITGVAKLRYYNEDTTEVLENVDVTTRAIANGDEVALTVEDRAFTVMPRAEGTVNITIQYMLANGKAVDYVYTATPKVGDRVDINVANPIVPGYNPQEPAELPDNCDYVINGTNTGIHISDDSIDEDISITIVYNPTMVEYVVKHYWQNADDDEYTLYETEKFEGLTDTFVSTKGTSGSVSYDNPELKNVYSGFYDLPYEKAAIAADGSTVIEIYYDRYYYLMTFDMDGGYGTEPIYARFGADLGDITEPRKTGYDFGGWSDGTSIIAHENLPDTMPAENRQYTAVWTNPQRVNYTIVYWKENADDNGYSFWNQEIKQATAGTTVNASDSITQTLANNEKNYFTWNEAKSDKDVVIEGDGSSVVNVYYTRNYYTILFKGYGKCAMTAHTHSTACQTIVCGFEPHTHGEGCKPTLTCQVQEHTHSSACCSLTTTHKEHTTSCYSNVNVNGTVNYEDTRYAPSNAVDGQIYRRGNRYNRVIYINGTWYRYSGSESSGTVVQPNNSCPGIHTHGDGNCNCNQTVHTHGEACYTYSCGYVAHAHEDDCYRDCNQPEHTHNTTCNTNNSNNVIYVITAKYEQNIADLWPTYDKLQASHYAYKDSDNNVENASGNRFRGWDIDGVSNEAVSKRVTMTSDLCDTNDGEKEAVAQYSATYTYHLYYMFESFDQDTSNNASDERKQYTNNGSTRWYDSDDDYYQVLVYSSDTTFNQKQITGMKAVGRERSTSGSGNSYVITNWLYYTRNRWSLKYQNVDTVVKTVSSIMYEQPLAQYKDSAGNLLSAYIPSYPSNLEPGVYKFEGWYTTPECYKGTRFDFSTAEMPNNDLTLYANWVPITRKVEFYLDRTAMEAGTKLGVNYPDLEVPHGTVVAADKRPADPTNGAYDFVNWFYLEDGIEKAFDFDQMTVTKNMKVYGKWSSNKLMTYTFYFKYKDANGTEIDIADPVTGSTLAGETKTEKAKGDTKLYPGYQEGYFPLVQSHSITLDIENEANNVFTFWYVTKDAMPYKVRYLIKNADDTVTPAFTNADGTEYIKTVSDNRKAIVTETFVVKNGYVADAYQKSLVVDADNAENNVITFYYTKDTTHAYYKATHYREPLEGNEWIEHDVNQYMGDIGTEYREDPLDIPGYTYDPNVTGTLQAGTLTENGLELKLYYTRNEYPYQVNYLEKGTNKVLATAKIGKADFGMTVQENAILIANYTAEAPTQQAITIDIEESQTTAKYNIITFYYVEKEVTINYIPVGPNGVNDGAGTVTPTGETRKVATDEAQGSYAKASNNTYKFVGWYSDVSCTADKWLSDEATYVPQKVDGLNVAATYYAKFEYNLTSLTIRKSGVDATLDPNTSFVFNISGDGIDLDVVIHGNGSATIDGLTVKETYTITEKSGSWRYVPDEASKTIELGPVASSNIVEFKNTREFDKWLDSEDSHENVFTNVSTTN